jgi:phage shock protein E
MIPLIIALGAAAIAYTFTGENLVSSSEAKKMIRSGKIKKVVDVRTLTEYRLGHYPRALHLPVTKMNEKTTNELPKKGLLVYCNTGQRARIAAEKLIELGLHRRSLFKLELTPKTGTTSKVVSHRVIYSTIGHLAFNTLSRRSFSLRGKTVSCMTSPSK